MDGSLLVVEDDPGIAEALARVLGRSGRVVETTGSGIDGVERLGRGGVALVVLDLGLPDLDGTEVCRQARAAGFTGPVLVLTAEHEARRREALAAGADDVLAKPFRVAGLVTRVDALLAGAGRGLSA